MEFSARIVLPVQYRRHMSRFFRFSPSRLALVYIGLGVLALALFAVPLWYGWRANIATFREYVGGEQTKEFLEKFDTDGAEGLADKIASRVSNLSGDEVIVFADPAKQRLAGNLNDWPPQIPDAPGTYGLVIALGGGATMRVVASHVILPGAYHLFLGRESVRFESLVQRFWYGIGGAMILVLLLGGLIGWLSHRALLNDVNDISRTASAIAKGDLSSRVVTSGVPDELDTLAQTVNGMLEQLAAQNMRLEEEVRERRTTEQALQRAQENLELQVSQRTGELVAVNEKLRKEIADHMLADEALRESEERFQRMADAIPEVIWITDLHPETMLYVSPSFATIWGRPIEDLYRNPRLWIQAIHPEDRVRVADLFSQWTAGEKVEYRNIEYRIVRPDGAVRWIEEGGVLSLNDEAKPYRASGISTDVTERKKADAERQAYLWFLESMDQINRAIQGTNNIEQMMSDVLDAVLSSFHCDRAWLVYPCDPDAPSWKVPMEHVRPEFPGAFALNLELPVDSEAARTFQTVRASDQPVQFGPGSVHPMPEEATKRFEIQSMIAMALYPKGDKPYMFGLHQCSYPRIWTRQEERLFQGIGRRLEDALTSLLVLRNLGESERKLEEAQRLSHVGYWERDPETDLIIWSDETYRIFGLKPQERILNLAELPDLIHPEDRQMMTEAVAEALRGRRRYDVEYRVVRPNGDVRLIHSQGDVVRDESGRPRRMFGSVQDITERKRAEQRLLTQHTVTQLLAEAGSLEEIAPKILETVCEFLLWDVGALWSVDRQAGVLRCVRIWHKDSVQVPEFETVSRNTTFMPGIGLPGRVWFSREPLYIPDIVRDSNFPRAPIVGRGVLHAGFGFPILLGGDVLAVMEFFSHEIREPDHELLNMMAILGSQIGQFIERKRAEDGLRRAQLELAHVTRVATLGEMSASIAHEINQPLGAIVNSASACLRWLDAQKMDEARRSAARAIEEGHRASEIIGRIRALAKKAPARKDWLDVNATIHEVIALANSEIHRNGIALETQLSDDVPTISADRIQLQQVLLNLIMNAVEAMSGSGDDQRALLIRSVADTARGVLIAVQDSGPGIDPASLDHLFDAFYTTKADGLGMGLAISRSLIEAHGGRLWATGNSPRGAIFQFTLPIGAEGAA
jgi:PAS domain S-box-containing protein